jgi:hypothetical protein
MSKPGRMARIGMAAALMLTLSGLPGYAQSEVTPAQLQAVGRTLGFLTSLSNAGALNIGVVYGQDQVGGEARAAQIVAMLGSVQGPGQRALHGTPVAVKDIAQLSQPFDAYLLLPGISGQGAAISDVVRRRHIVSISTDPACLVANCCVLMVSVEGRVRIVLDTALADAAGAKFSSVFAMMVTRK